MGVCCKPSTVRVCTCKQPTAALQACGRLGHWPQRCGRCAAGGGPHSRHEQLQRPVLLAGLYKLIASQPASSQDLLQLCLALVTDGEQLDVLRGGRATEKHTPGTALPAVIAAGRA